MKKDNKVVKQHEYAIGNHIFVVTPVYKEEKETSETIGTIILKLLKNDAENDNN